MEEKIVKWRTRWIFLVSFDLEIIPLKKTEEKGGNRGRSRKIEETRKKEGQWIIQGTSPQYHYCYLDLVNQFHTNSEAAMLSTMDAKVEDGGN